MKWHLLDDLIGDLRYTFRQMLRSPGFTAVAIIILAVGIGANSALFSFVDTLLFKPAPGLQQPGSLVEINRPDRESFGKADFQFLEEQQQNAFTGLAASFELGTVQAEIDNAIVSARIEFVSNHYFTTLRPVMALGYAPVPDGAGRLPGSSVVISYDLWQSAFGGRRDVLNKTIHLNGTALTIAGVLGRDYFYPVAIFAPLTSLPTVMHEMAAAGHPPEYEMFLDLLVGRLRDGVTRASAQSQVTALLRRIPKSTHSAGVISITPMRATSNSVLHDLLPPLALVGNVTLFMMLIAAANASVLLLSRAVGRRREIAIRLAVGAERRRLIRQLLTEGVVLAIAACIAGLLVLNWMTAGLERLFFPGAAFSLSLRWTTLAASLAFALITGMLFALAPALQLTRNAHAEVLSAGAATADARSARMQRVFVIAEVALSMALVCATGIFADAAVRKTRSDAGFMTSPQTIVSSIPFYNARLQPSQIREDLDRFMTRVAAIDGVERVSAASGLPSGSSGYVDVVGAGFVSSTNSMRSTRESPVRRRTMSLSAIGPELFATLGVPIVSGRDIAPADRDGSDHVAVVDELVARSLWPRANPIGQTLNVRRWYGGFTRTDTAVLSLRVVGVAPVLDGGAHRTVTPTIYIAAAQFPGDLDDATVVVRSSARSARPLVHAVSQALHSVDQHVHIGDVQTLADIYRSQHRNIYNAAIIAAVAGITALLLACVGLYATISFGLKQRTREIGVRRALGATDHDVVYAFFEDGMRLALIGFAIGIPVALSAMKIGVAERFGVQTLTTSSIAMVMGALLVVCALASWLPARRAARIDAITALRQD